MKTVFIALRAFFIVLPVLLFMINSSQAQISLNTSIPKVAKALSAKLQDSDDDTEHLVWIFFTDKGFRTHEEEAKQIERWVQTMDPKALRRRTKISGQGKLISVEDLPVCDSYLDQVKKTGAKIRNRSRWFNAVSVMANREEIRQIAQLPFVRSIESVGRYHKPEGKEIVHPLKKVSTVDTTKYGPSYPQLKMLNVPLLHDMGLTGANVRICMLDAGFQYKGVEIFSRIKIIAERDFVGKTMDIAGENHGTLTLSIIGGYKLGILIGPAYDAEYILARTEDTTSETPVEEDNWIAAAEWADSLGTDIISSSLGYNSWDPGTGRDYTYSDMNGHTARLSIAANKAANRGIVVVNAAGNERNTGWEYVITPADADSVIAVGAVDMDNHITSFSSKGPTYDGRIKPDVVAPGLSVIGFLPGNKGGFYENSGTSVSTPLVAGIAALLLQAHSDWKPMEVKAALQRSGDHTLDPNNDYGWGLVDALKALQADKTVYGVVVDRTTETPVLTAKLTISSLLPSDTVTVSRSGRFLFTNLSPGYHHTLQVFAPRYEEFLIRDITVPMLSQELKISMKPEADLGELVYAFPNPADQDGTYISFSLKRSGNVKIQIFSISGELVKTIEEVFTTNGRKDLLWDGKNSQDRFVGSGIYLYRVQTETQTVKGKVALIRQ